MANSPKPAVDIPCEALPPDPAGRQSYSPPTLTVYGDVHEITRTVGPYGRFDNARRSRRTGFDQGNCNNC